MDEIDQGSYDDCQLDSVVLRRLYNFDPVTCDPVQPYFSEWGEYVDFSCCDVRDFVILEMRVVDISGNVNMCWLNVLVQDCVTPTLSGIEDLNTSCDLLPADFDPFDQEQRIQLFGIPTVIDNCGAEVAELEVDVDLSDCLEGTIIRRFVALDYSFNFSEDTLEQVITIENTKNYEIKFPKDAETNCFDYEDSLEIYRGCDLLTVSFEDEFLEPEGEECYYLARTYYVIDWCEYNGTADPEIISRDEECDVCGWRRRYLGAASPRRGIHRSRQSGKQSGSGSRGQRYKL